MEFIGWATTISLCVFGLLVIIFELSLFIYTEISSWNIRKDKALEAKEEKAKFKSDMEFLKRQATMHRYMLKHDLKPGDLKNNISTDITDASEETTCDENEEVDDGYY